MHCRKRALAREVVSALAALYCATAAMGAAPPIALQSSSSPPASEIVPRPAPAVRPTRRPTTSSTEADRLVRINAVGSWGYQLSGLVIEEAARSPFDLLVIDATAGLAADRRLTEAEIERLKWKPDGTRRLVVSYLSIGEAEDYRPDYFDTEYLKEDAPDWLLNENPQWKGNRLIRFCEDGWQQTIIGDEAGHSPYNSIDPSPLQRLIELGFDGVYLDRADVYSEVRKECPEAEKRMVAFIARLAARARARTPQFLVILQNAEELLRHKTTIEAVDAIAKEDLFYGEDHTQKANSAETVRESLSNLRLAKAAGRAVLVVDYLDDKVTARDTRRKIEAHGFIPYIGPRDLGHLWLPGVHF